MPLFITSLNSGSNGNCYYIGNDTEAVLIDAGISCRETERRMTRLGLSLSTVKAIFVSHEHSDHITGVPGISKKYQIPVFITDATHKGAGLPIQEHLLTPLQAGDCVRIGTLQVTAFRKSHDAVDPHSFLVSQHGVNIGIFTDIGHCCKRVISHFGKCHAAFLESNYCATMLENGDYPYHLKRRISSDDGHLSNAQALELFQHFRHEQLSLLILAHLSKNNNHPELVERLFTEVAGKTKVVVASRYQETPVFTVGGEPISLMPRKTGRHSAQLTLF